MQLTPAILVNNIEQFKQMIDLYKQSDSIDIDICRTPFTKADTLQLNQISKFLDFDMRSIGLHLMVEDPVTDLELLKQFSNYQIRVYLHQESDLGCLKNFEWPSFWHKCLAVKMETELLTLEYYKDFTEVQLMSVEIGSQGGEFNPLVIEKVNKLKSLGYAGRISLDGGINERTILQVKNLGIDRLSIGSFFQKSQNFKESFRILTELLQTN
jgi:ribulose-phosphate 3-epimerase